MPKLFFDIETLPAEERDYKKLKEVYDRKVKKGMGTKLGSFEDFVESTSLDGTWGKVLCIGYAIDDGLVQCLSGEEKEIIKNFWEIAKKVDLFVGFNVIDFDLRFLVQRSIILGVKPSVDISFRRYVSNPVYDVMWEWTKWGNRISLDELARALGIPSSKGELDGSQVHEYYKKGKIEEITKYCGNDVEVTRKIYKKINFEI